MTEQRASINPATPSMGRPGEYRILHGEKPVELKDLLIDNATLDGLVDFVGVRQEEIANRDNETHFRVSPKQKRISLFIGECGGHGSPYTPSITVHASSAFTKDRQDVDAIMNGNHRPHELAMKLRELPHLFSDESSWRDAVAKLRSLQMKVSKAVKDTSNEESGEREKAVKLVIESGAMEIEWNWLYSIYEGTDPVTVPVRVLYEADEDMSGVFVRVFNPRKVAQERKALEELLEATLTNIRAIVKHTVPIVTVNS